MRWVSLRSPHPTGYDMTDEQSRAASRWLSAAGIFACACNVISVVGIDYQNYIRLVEIQRNDISSLLSIGAAESHVIMLCPILVLLIARRSVAVVLMYVFVLFVILAGRVYYLLPQSLTGVDGLYLKQDWSSLLQILVDVPSGIVVVFWTFIRIFAFAVKQLNG